MNRTISNLPTEWKIIAFGLLVLGTISVLGFITRYTIKMPWMDFPEGKHLVAMSANVGAFFVLYLVLSVWPDFPVRDTVRIGLLIAIVANCVHRWVLFEKHLRARKRKAARADHG